LTLITKIPLHESFYSRQYGSHSPRKQFGSAKDLILLQFWAQEVREVSKVHTPNPTKPLRAEGNIRAKFEKTQNGEVTLNATHSAETRIANKVWEMNVTSALNCIDPAREPSRPGEQSPQATGRSTGKSSWSNAHLLQ
jgi:hypothetical protein